MLQTQDLRSYAGNIERIIHDGQPSLAFNWDSARNSRHVTRKFYSPGVRVAGWVRPMEIRADKNWDGIHVHVGHIGNDRNYVASIVRNDGRQKIAVEYGWHGYQTIDSSPSEGVELVEDRTYMFEVVWSNDQIATWVGSEAGQSEMHAEIPEDRFIPTGAVGLRLDNMQCRGGFTVEVLR